MNNSLRRVDHVTISYNGKPVVSDVSFELKQGEILGIVGESGSGKSTIIKAIMGLLGEEGMVTRGDIWYKGENLTEMSEKNLRKYLGTEIGMVFQDCKAALCPVRTIGVQIHEAVSEHEKTTIKEIRQRAASLMKKIGLEDGNRILDSYPFELSGGMNQRDVTVQKQVVEELLLMRKEYHTAMILVTHNIGVVRKMADRILVLKNGLVRDYGETEKVLDYSQDDYTQELMNSVLHLKRGAE